MRVSIPGERADRPRRVQQKELQECPSQPVSSPVQPMHLPAEVARQKTLQSIRNRHMEEAATFVSELDVAAKHISTIQDKFLKAGVGGRKMTEEVVLEILNRMCRGETLKTICQDAHLPSYGTVQKWYTTDPDFQQAMDMAKSFQMNLFADEILDIADNSVGDIRLAYDKHGNLVPEVNYENVKRSELRIKTRMELMKVYNRKQFGTQKETATNVPGSQSGSQLSIQIVLPDNGRNIAPVVVDI